jgi:hypothetical protein
MTSTLIKKKEDSCTPNAYSPISLLNCSVKLITKVLAFRLQDRLHAPVDQDQSGFVQSRNISDSFIYALELIQTCRTKQKMAVVLKLDFRKAFDTVSWDSPFRILHIRGFDSKWIKWIHLISSTVKIAILLNSITDPWIQTKRGLRQGDPLSPPLPYHCRHPPKNCSMFVKKECAITPLFLIFHALLFSMLMTC